ncbi:G-protein coupled receptor moody-like [Copidosoma floridanum]|uniref:G-protein coupled receptor moody-like n=1 Tax=Copidosoma floridanum TaxID=29053 RepID=UPI000C6F850E|nr:G-protein coupled receptor moody-like [Copidosoma floridanum]
MTYDYTRFSGPLRNFTVTVALTITIVGISGNLLTIIALLKYPKVRNVAAAFIISLCVSDFIFCLLVLPFDSIRFYDASWTKNRFLCVLVPFLRYGNVGVSLLLVGLLSIHRYVMIAHHGIFSRVYKRHWIAAMILFCWVFSYGMQVPTLMNLWGKFAYDEKLGTCSIVKDDFGRSPKAFLFIMGFVIPCMVIVGCYAKIFWVVHKSESRMRMHAATPSGKSPHALSKDARETKQRRSEWRITKMVLAIFLGFIVCYLPITIVKVYDTEVEYPEFHVLGYLLLYLSSCINPIIYVIMNKQYRQAYAGVISCSKIRASFTSHGSSAPGQNHKNNVGHHQDYSKDYSKTMVSTVSIAMNSVKDADHDDYI